MTTNNSVNNDLSNPIIRTGVKDANGNVMFSFAPTASAVNYFNFQNTATGGAPTFYVAGSDTNIPMTLLSQGNKGVNIKGTATNDSASAGYVGEVISSAVAGNSVSMTSTVAANVTSISLTAGDWDVTGWVYFLQDVTTTASQLLAAINTTSATVPSTLSPSITNPYSRVDGLTTSAGATNVLSLSKAIISLSSTTTVYLVARAAFITSTLTTGGVLMARRVR